ncbi:MAG: DUF4080 domain-containing protein [Lachnospiraceae bacterium]|nr:DUF4080 domain-containing protein [Lachnospiraceae bacterium]
MKCLLAAINAKYIHSNPAVYSLKAYAEKAAKEGWGARGIQVEFAEYTINHRAAEILDDIYMKEADILCFSCYIWNIEYVKTLVKNLKQLNPAVPIWLGGPEVSFACEERLAEIPEADGILYGEGERSFPELLRFYEDFYEKKDGNCRGLQRKDTDSYKLPRGFACRGEGGEIIITPPQDFVDMDEIPFYYKTMWGKAVQGIGEPDTGTRIIYYESSRGCPFSCSYCLSSVDKRLRFRSLAMVYEELGFFLEKRVPQVKFVDRTFNCRKSRAMAIWTFLRDHDNGVTNFHFEIGADLLDEEAFTLFETMRPGLIQLEIGVQSANQETLKAIHRTVDMEKLRTAVMEVGRGKNIRRHLDLIAGLPFEDYESFGRSFDEVYSMGPDELQLGFLKVLKGTPMYADAARYHIVYQTEAPFEVLKTRWLSHEDVIHLKQVENMVEIYYNSRQFLFSIKLLLSWFGRPFLMYEALGREYVRKAMEKRKHVRAELYEFLLDYVKEHFSAKEEQFRQSLTLDYYLRENAKKRPGFAIPLEPYRDAMRKRLGGRFPDIPMKQLLKDYHVEVFEPPFSEGREYWLFDYGNRDALTGNAAVIRL